MEAEKLGVEFHFDAKNFFQGLDVVVLSVPIIRWKEAVGSLPIQSLRGKLVVGVSQLNEYTRSILLEPFANYPDIDVMVANPLLGILPREEDQANDTYLDTSYNSDGVTIMNPFVSGPTTVWEGRKIVIKRVRVADVPRCDRYLQIFENTRCEVIEEMTNDHEEAISDAQFLTHLVGRLLDQDILTPTPVMSKEYEDLTKISQMAAAGSFDRFYGMYNYNKYARDRIKQLRENLASLECELAAKGAYLSATQDLVKGDQQKLLSEMRILLREVAKSELDAADDNVEAPSIDVNAWFTNNKIPPDNDELDNESVVVL